MLLSPNTIFKLMPNPPAGARDLNLEADEWRVRTMVNGTNTLAAICTHSGLAPERVAEIAERLMRERLIVVKGGLLDLSLSQREFEAWYKGGGNRQLANHVPRPLTGDEERKLAFKIFFAQRPHLRRRRDLVAIGQQLLFELLTYQVELRRQLLGGAPGAISRRMARLTELAETIKQGCGRLLGESGVISLRLGLVDPVQHTSGAAGAPDDLDWAREAPLETLAAAVIGWYQARVEELALLYGQLQSEGGALFGPGEQPATRAAPATYLEDELLQLPGLAAQPPPTTNLPDATITARAQLLARLPALEALLHALILRPPGEGDRASAKD
jgi:hypothetical protein